MSNLSQFFGASGGIKSIQRGVISAQSTPTTVTISAVDTSKSILYFLGNTSGVGLNVLGIGFFAVLSRIELTNSTTITCTGSPIFPGNPSSWSSSTTYGTVSWQLVEYN